MSLTQDTSNPDIKISKRTFRQEAVWVNATFLSPNFTDRERPHQPRIAPHCSSEDEGLTPPWSDCQSSITRWADQDRTFSFSPNMMVDPGEEFAMKQGLFLQDLRMHPFHKWVLCGVNGSCTDLNPLVFIQGGAVGKASFTGISRFFQYWGSDSVSSGTDGTTTTYANSTVEITGFNKTLVNQTNYPPTPVCVYPPFLFILSNDSFEACSNDSCWMS